ncbi:hypothetical protein DFH94DRAFT_723179 [Russula ochroleuca]|jgi:hypothetical protein|uniref:Uncharacterized protein n=1 Tax=Russula ochroleuca TaxID=152965 RepID=A0A9P5N1E1_9AGAM|nr:hypothetical protein DFH94DRAFT_723179 [Russula ochroleuca]
MTTLKPDAFEEIFRKLEEESERRALEADSAPSPNIPDLSIAAQQAAQRRQRTRGSISISRFGHFDEDTQQQTTLSPSQTPPAFVHGMTTFTPVYGAQSYNHSADSLSDESFFGGDDNTGLSAESEHVTQVHRIAGRQSLPRSVGGILQRTLTRSWTNSSFSSSGINTNVVVGVVVEQDHVEDPEPREGLPRRSMVYAQPPSTLRPQPSRVTIPGAERSWKSKAGELFRRKGRPWRSALWSTPSQES